MRGASTTAWAPRVDSRAARWELPAALAASVCLHIALCLVPGNLPTSVPKAPTIAHVRVVEPPPPQPAQQPAPEPPRAPRVRRPVPGAAPAAPVAGIRDSVRHAERSSVAAPEGNSLEVPVVPHQETPPSPGGFADPDGGGTVALEAAADTPARCKEPELDLTEDALAAGVRSGRLEIEVQVSSKGRILSARLVKGTGYLIDGLALDAARSLKCTPATRAGVPVALAKKKLLWTIRSE